MTDEEMDNFVLAVLPKKTAAKMQKELQDLVNNPLFRYTGMHSAVMECVQMHHVTFFSTLF